MQFPSTRAGHSREGTRVSAAVCCSSTLSVSWPQQGREPRLLCPSAAVQSKLGPPPDQTHADPFSCCRATTTTSFGCTKKDFGFTTRTPHCRRRADKPFCWGEGSIELCVCCLHGCVVSRTVLTAGFAARKVALSSWLPHTNLILPP